MSPRCDSLFRDIQSEFRSRPAHFAAAILVREAIEFDSFAHRVSFQIADDCTQLTTKKPSGVHSASSLRRISLEIHEILPRKLSLRTTLKHPFCTGAVFAIAGAIEPFIHRLAVGATHALRFGLLTAGR